VRVWAARALIAASIIGWPTSALTVARDEPQFVLGLSWLALLFTAVDFLTTAHVHEKGDQP
jgi:hypothetical protein